MSVDALAEYLLEQLHHEIVTDAWAAQLKDSNYEDDQVRDEFESILQDTESFAKLFDGVSKLAEKVTESDGDTPWKTLLDAGVDTARVNGFFWVFLDKALAKDSNTRDVEYGFSAACAWLKLAGLKTSTLYHFFNQYIYKMVLSVFRLVYRLKMYGSRYATTKKKTAPKGKKGTKKSGPVREEEDEEEHPLDFNGTELEDMLEKACDSLYGVLKNTALSICPDQAKESVDLIRDFIRLDVYKDAHTGILLSQRDINARDRICDRAFGLAHLLCQSIHSTGGVVLHTHLILPRLLFFSWEEESVPGNQSIPAIMNVARDLAIQFLKKRIEFTTDEEEQITISKLVSNMIFRCPDRAEYRHRVSQSALALLALLPKKLAHAQLQIVFTFGMTTKTGLRAMTVEMIPTLIKEMDLTAEEEEEERSRKKKKGDDEEEEEDEGNKTKRKEKKKKGSDEEEEEEDEERNKTNRKYKRKESDEEEEEDGNTTKRKKNKGKAKKKIEDNDEEEEEEGNTTRGKRGRAAKDQSMMRMKKQKKRDEDGSEVENSEDEEVANKKKQKKKEADAKMKKKKSAAKKMAPVDLRPNLLILVMRGCIDKAGNLRARSLQQVSLMVGDGMGDELKDAADRMVKEHTRVILQATTHLDDDKNEGEGEDEVDEEEKARAAKLIELAAAELNIENGLVYIVRSRMEDDVAAVRKAAIATLESVFFQWNMNGEEADDTVNALKTRCLDTSLMVRKQAMDTLSSLLARSLEKGEHRELMEVTWLRAVLPLINDRENSVQAMAAKLVEEHVINPIMRSNTPEACWKMLKRVEEEVSNRRLLVRTLAYLSQQKLLKENIVNILNKKLESDTDHSSVLWMLLADLSTVFKIDPKTAVNTWYNLPETATTNTTCYVAKVVGEGSERLKDREKDTVSQDMETKLLEYRVHGPHIPTVYLALARLMDAVGEKAIGGEELERFGRKLLDEASRIIYQELQMFDEKDESEQEVTKEEEMRVIRIVITIGEVIQLSPNLIDHAKKLLEGLKDIMASELFLSDAYRLRKLGANSAVPSLFQSRVPSAMGNRCSQPMGSQGSTQNTMIYGSEGQPASQQNVIPSQIANNMKTLSLRKALFSPSVRRCALTTIGKFCLMDESIAKECVYGFVRQLKLNPDHIIRNNIVVVLCDLCIRYTLLVDRYTPIIASCLKDRSTLVRHQTLECLTILIKEAFIRWEGQLMYRFVATILDEDRPIREYASFCLKDILLPQNPCMFFNHFIECLLYFNDIARKYQNADTLEDSIDRSAKFSLSGRDNEGARLKLYEFMLETFDDKQKFLTMAKMCEEIFSAVYTGEMNIGDERVVALLEDSFKVISSEQMQLRLETGRKDGDEEGEEAPQAVQDAAKNMITSVFRTAIITSIMPHVLELRRFLMERKLPILQGMFKVIRALTRSHMDQLHEFFTGDKLAFRELEYDIKRINAVEDKMKLMAAKKKEEEAVRAAVIRRKSMMGRDGEEKKKEGEKEKNGREKEELRKEDEEERIEAVVEMENGGGEGDGESVDVEMDDGKEEEEEKKKRKNEEKKKKEKVVVESNVRMEDENEEKGENDDEVFEPEVNGGEEEEEEVVSEKKKRRVEKKAEIPTSSASNADEVEVKEEIVEEEEEVEKEKNEKKGEEGRNKIGEAEIKDEPMDEDEAQIVRPSGGSKRTRDASVAGWMNETAVVGGYGQSTPKKKGDGDENDEDDGRLNLDISAIGPPPAAGKKGRISRKPLGETIQE